MKKLALTAALAAFFATGAFAQTPGPGGDRAAAVPAATPAQKAAARQARIAEGKAVTRTSTAGDDQPATAAGKNASPAEKKLAKAKRKAAGAEAVKAKEKAAP